MRDLLLGLGMVLAAVGPILLLPLLWLVCKVAYRPLLGVRIARGVWWWPETWAGCGASRWLPAVLALSYLPGRHAFDALCATEGISQVYQRVSVAGSYRTSLFPYEAYAYLREGGIQFVGAPDPQPARRAAPLPAGTRGHAG